MRNYKFNFRGKCEYCAGETAEEAFKKFTEDYNCDIEAYSIDDTKTRLLQYDAETRGKKWAQLKIAHSFIDDSNAAVHEDINIIVEINDNREAQGNE